MMLHLPHNTKPVQAYLFLSKRCELVGSQCGISMNKKRKSEMLLFCQNTGLSIEFDEQINCFAFHRLSVAKDIELFNNYAYVCFNGIALFFSGWDGISKKATDAVHKYSIAGDTRITLKHKLPFPLYLQTNLLRVKKIVRSPIVKMTGREREGVAENAEGAEGAGEKEQKKEREENEKEDI
ncbi:hypothetical protein RFI_34125, partial [Reticulomyxa filosa]